MHFFDLQQDFFRPLWRRVVMVLFCLGRAAFEFITGAPFWGMIFAGAGLLAVWQFFFDGWPERDSAPGAAPDADDENGA